MRLPHSRQMNRRFPIAVCLTIATLGSCAVPSTHVATPSSPRTDPPPAIVPRPVATASAPATVPPCVSAPAIVASAERADQAMREIATTNSIGDAHAAAARLAELLRQLLPSDTDGPPDGPIAALITRSGAAAAELDTVALGGLATWSRPRERYDQWRAVLAAWRPDRNTMPQLPSHLLRALGWVTLVARSDDLGAARGLASAHGVIHTGLVLDAAQTVATRAQAACP